MYKPPSPAALLSFHREHQLCWHDYADLWLTFPLGNVLDYGCGDGTFLKRVADRSREQWGVDIDEEVLERAAAGTRIRTHHVAPRQPLPFHDTHFDTIILMEVIEHVSDERAVLSECARVLAPGGTLLLTTPHNGLLTFLDPGNFKFAAPRLHRFIHCHVLGRKSYYEERFGPARRSVKGMIADFALDQPPWHRHYSYEQVRALAPPELETLAWAVYFPAFRALRCLRTALRVTSLGRLRRLPQPLRRLNNRLSRVPGRFGDQLVILFRKQP